MKLRLRSADWMPFVRSLCARRDVETAGIILAEKLNGDVLLGRHYVEVPESGYQIREVDQLRVAPLAINRIVRRARDEGLSVLTVHTHPGAAEPWFSLADDDGDSRLIPSLFAQMSGPHGSIVVAGETSRRVGRAWNEIGACSPMAVHVVGSNLHVAAGATAETDSSDWFGRQRLALGEHGHEILRGLHVGVVGVGGVGSVALVQLAHLGVGQISVVDGDIVEHSNVSRIVGSTAHDAGASSKVQVAHRYVEALGLGTKFRSLDGQLGIDVPSSVLAECDVIVACVDRHTPRALLNRLAYDKAIPLVDVGSGFRVDKSGRMVGAAGRVVIVGPERPCLACWGHIDPDRLRIEALSPSDRSRQAAEGYVDGADVPQPSVIPFNTTLAGAAVIELLRLVTGFAGADDLPLRLSFDFVNGTVRRNQLAQRNQCVICSSARHVH